MKPVAEILELPTANRLVFKCPGCLCSHGVNVMLKNSAQGPLWTWNGSFERPTLSPSVHVSYDPHPPPDRPAVCHSFVRDGMIQFLGDCTHHLAGKTVALEPVDD